MALSFIPITLLCALVFGVCDEKLSSLALASVIAMILAAVLVACKACDRKAERGMKIENAIASLP